MNIPKGTYSNVNRDDVPERPLTLEDIQRVVERCQAECPPPHPLAQLGPLSPAAFDAVRRFLEAHPDLRATYSCPPPAPFFVRYDPPPDDHVTLHRVTTGYMLTRPLAARFLIDWSDEEAGELWLTQVAFDRMCERAERELRGTV